jgi:hypothetical protein
MPMFSKTGSLKIEFSRRDRKFTLIVGFLLLMTGLGLMGSNWKPASFAPLAIMMGLFLLCLILLAALRRD